MNYHQSSLIKCVPRFVDFGYDQIVVRDGKGQKDRVTVLPSSLKEALRKHLLNAKSLHERVLQRGTDGPPFHVRSAGNTYDRTKHTAIRTGFARISFV